MKLAQSLTSSPEDNPFSTYIRMCIAVAIAVVWLLAGHVCIDDIGVFFLPPTSMRAVSWSCKDRQSLLPADVVVLVRVQPGCSPCS